MTDAERNELKSAYEDYVEASMYSSGDDWGGNPHRQMEYEAERDARRRFVELCKKYGVNPDEIHKL